MKTDRIRCFPFILCAAILLVGVDSTNARSSSTSGDSGGHTNKGVQVARNKQYDKAIAEFTKAIEAQPSDPKNYANRALSYKLSGKPDQAISDFAKVIARKMRTRTRTRVSLSWSKAKSTWRLRI